MDTKSQRQTKYCFLAQSSLQSVGHATNLELLSIMRRQFPKISATTVHRITSRLHRRGLISLAPATNNGSIVYDCNITPHDHFQCTSCHRLLDINVKSDIVPIIEKSLSGCKISDRLLIKGVCNNCTQI